MNISKLLLSQNVLNARKILIAALVTAVFIGNDCYGQSFKDKLKAKAAGSTTKNTGSTTKGGATYYLMEAERGKTKVQLEEGENNGTKIIAINGAMYTYQDEPSATLGKKIYFTTAGIYVIEYDDNSWVSVMPTKQLGKAPWDKFAFSNFYSTDAAKAKGMTKAKVEAYAIKLSKQILAPSTSGPSKGGDGTYSAATPVKFSGKAYPELEIVFEDGAIKKIVTKLTKEEASFDTYMLMPEFSKLIGVDIYANSRSHLNQYIFMDKPGVLIWARYKNGGLGNQLWEKYDYYNMFAMDKQVTRGLINSENKQKELDVKVANWSKTIKDSEDKRRASETKDKIAKQRLPKEGLIVANLKGQTLDAAKAWASKWGWKETVTKAYFNDADWYIYRHKKTGVILRREIRGTIVMTRPDGMCSFHYCVFGQQYNGSTYNKVYTAGITPGQIKLHCEYAK
jgi:hypothetical protein